jgi:Ca2+-binding RTX toxin-like protein
METSMAYRISSYGWGGWSNYADTIRAYFSQDTIPTNTFPFGQPGFIGGSGADVYTSGSGSDLTFGQNGNDVLRGGGGNDTIAGGGGFNELRGDDGNDMLYGGNHGNLLKGGFGNDQIFGGRSGDKLDGDWGNDKLYGYEGNDKLYGGFGNDTLTGGVGRDILKDDAGSDVFLFLDRLGNGNVDDIQGFNSYLVTGRDRIGLSKAIFSSINGSAGSTLSSSEFHAGSGPTSKSHHVIYNIATGDLLYDPDGNGGRAAIQFAHLDPGTSLRASDFYLV